VSYCRDQSHTTGIVVGLDQKTSGFGHLACLMQDAEMAEMSNVTGTRDFDIYALVGERTREILLEAMEDPDIPSTRFAAMRWWLDHWPGRKTFKAGVMPMLYGRSYTSLVSRVSDLLAEEVGQYHTEEGYRVALLSHVLAKRLWAACKETFPQVREYTRWMGRYASKWIDRGTDARWITPNGLVVDRFTRESGYQIYSLPIRGKRISFTARDRGGLKKPSTWGGHCADLVHSMDAAFCQRAVAGWQGQEIASIHDCFLTTVDQLWPMREHLLSTYREIYERSWLDVIDAYQWDETPPNRGDGLDRKSSTSPPFVRTLEVERIGENPHLFG
jgi:DNA-directed RNA polymerase